MPAKRGIEGVLVSNGRAWTETDADGRLEIREVMAALEIDAEGLVLLACEIVLGPAFAGAGPFGLGKGFAFAGADRVAPTRALESRLRLA